MAGSVSSRRQVPAAAIRRATSAVIGPYPASSAGVSSRPIRVDSGTVTATAAARPCRAPSRGVCSQPPRCPESREAQASAASTSMSRLVGAALLARVGGLRGVGGRVQHQLDGGDVLGRPVGVQPGHRIRRRRVRDVPVLAGLLVALLGGSGRHRGHRVGDGVAVLPQRPATRPGQHRGFDLRDQPAADPVRGDHLPGDPVGHPVRRIQRPDPDRERGRLRVVDLSGAHRRDRVGQLVDQLGGGGHPVRAGRGRDPAGRRSAGRRPGSA